MKIKRRGIIIFAATSITGVVLLLWGINRWAGNKARFLLDQEVQEGHFSYASLDINIFSNRFIIRQPHWITKSTHHKSNEIKIEEVRLSDFSCFKYIFHNTINIGEILFINPEVIIHPRDTTQQIQPLRKNNLSKPINIEKTEVVDGTIRYFKEDTTELSFSCLFPVVSLKNIRIDSLTMNQKMPFEYDEAAMTGRSLYYKMSNLYDLEIRKFSNLENDLFIDSLLINPRYGNDKFQRHISHEKSRVNLSIPSVEIAGILWDMNRDTALLAASKMTLDSAFLDLYKDNRLPDNPYFKPMYSRLIRELPVKIDIDSVEVNEAAVTFQLATIHEPPPGIVYFENINGQIVHLSNLGIHHRGFMDTSVRADARFMKESPIHLNWTFNTADAADDFHVSGSLSGLSDRSINYFVTPVMNIAMEGSIRKLAFNFAGNNNRANGDMYINYNSLRVNLLKKDGTKRKAWISAIVNLFLKNKLDGPIEKKDIVVERIQTKSFWNYLWVMVKKGTLESIN